MEKHAQKMMRLQEKTIELLEKLSQQMEDLSNLLLGRLVPGLKDELLDNTDLKGILRVGDTKFFRLKKCKFFPAYRLNGKDYYLQSEVLEAIRRNRFH